MSWWGKLFGGAVGFALGGPLGGIVGAALGHRLDRSGEAHGTGAAGAPLGVEILRASFFGATFSVMGHMAKADGRVTPEEIRLASTLMQRMGLPRPLRRFARELFRQGKATEFPLQDVLHQLRGQTRSRDLLRMFLEIQVFAAYADGTVHPRERAILQHICETLGFDAATLSHVEALVRSELAGEAAGASRHANDSRALANAYAVLGVSATTEDAQVKRAYRRLMSQHHPDKLVSRGLPEEMMQLATRKTREIRAAYERVKAARRDRPATSTHHNAGS